jgi:hypothetical protein
MVNETNRKRLPPYISYRTFRNFLEGLQQGIPSRIDRSYWGDRFSGSTGTQLLSGLRFLGLIDNSSTPTNQLKQLVNAQGKRRVEILRQISSDAFVFLLGSTFNPQQATYAQLEEVFHNMYQITDDVTRKCIKFFIGMATDAEIPLSPFILRKSRTIRLSSGTKKVSKRTGNRTNQNSLVPQNIPVVPQNSSWTEMLLMKFPSFDPAWPTEVKLKWFEDFDQLLKRGVSLNNEKGNSF